jgi:hypothetical protein
MRLPARDVDQRGRLRREHRARDVVEREACRTGSSRRREQVAQAEDVELAVHRAVRGARRGQHGGGDDEQVRRP